MLCMTNFEAATAGAGGTVRARGQRDMSGLMQAVTVAGAVGAGLVGGVFFAFSGFVMSALRQLPTAHGISAMQSINRTAVQPPLMLALFGTALLSVTAVIWALRSGGTAAAPWMLAGGLAYLAAVVITIVANVPLNDTLAGLNPASASAQAYWPGFLTRWTLWNHLRGAAAVGGGLAFIVALLLRGR